MKEYRALLLNSLLLKIIGQINSIFRQKCATLYDHPVFHKMQYRNKKGVEQH